MKIQIEKLDETNFRVRVDGPPPTLHTVTITPEYWRKLTGARISVEDLLEKSFTFLLDRESNTSILSSFELPVIQRYFPEYERTIARITAEPLGN